MIQRGEAQTPALACTSIELAGAAVQLYPDLLVERSVEWFNALREQVVWQQHQLTLFGKSLAAPRLSAWYGDPDAHYSYSNIQLLPNAWIKPLLDIKHIVESVSGAEFNSVLANLYRDGNDSMGWHADDEVELGCEPVIASVSLGVQRRIRWRHSARAFTPQSTELPNGSLLLMRARTQREWQHCVPKVANLHAARINLTYRWVSPVEL